jgi:hypothetical protein
MLCWEHGDARFAVDLHRDVVPTVDRPAQDRSVYLVVVETRSAIVTSPERECARTRDALPRPHELREVRPSGPGMADHEVALTIRCTRYGVVHSSKRSARIRRETNPGGRRSTVMRRTIEQRRPDDAFELCHGSREGRLAHMEHRSGSAEVPLVDHTHEGAQVAELDRHTYQA